MELSLGEVSKSLCTSHSISELKNEVARQARLHGMELQRAEGHRNDVPTDFRLMDLVLKLAGDPESGLGEYAQGVRVETALATRRTSQTNFEYTWRSKYASVAPLEDEVLEVLHDQASRGQIVVLSELEAKKQYPSLFIASPGANREDKPDGQITARVFFDGTHGLQVNRRTWVQDQERAPTAADLKGCMRAKAARDEATFAVTVPRAIVTHPKMFWPLITFRCNLLTAIGAKRELTKRYYPVNWNTC